MHAGRLHEYVKPAANHVKLLPFLLVPILAQTLFAFVRGNLMTFTFATAGHSIHCLVTAHPSIRN